MELRGANGAAAHRSLAVPVLLARRRERLEKQGITILCVVKCCRPIVSPLISGICILICFEGFKCVTQYSGALAFRSCIHVGGRDISNR